jgi:hypothetical protein
MEEPLLRMIEEAMEQHDLVAVDDLHLFAAVLHDNNPPRSHLLDAALTAILAEAAVRKKTLVFAVEDEAPFPIQRRANVWELGVLADDRTDDRAYSLGEKSREFRGQVHLCRSCPSMET